MKLHILRKRVKLFELSYNEKTTASNFIVFIMVMSKTSRKMKEVKNITQFNSILPVKSQVNQKFNLHIRGV